jgi:SAM-dependent methyltransferase
MKASTAESMATNTEADTVRQFYLARDRDHQYERQWGYVNPAAAAYWRIRDELVVEAVVNHYDVLTKKLSALEVGVGHGHELAKLALLGIPHAQLTGVDVAPDRLARAREIYPAIQFDSSDAAALPYRDESFDIVCQFTCVMHAASKASQEQITREMTRVLRPDGIIIWWDVAPARWRVIVAQRLAQLLAGKASLSQAARHFRQTIGEALLPRRRRESVSKSLPSYILPIPPEDLARWFSGMKVEVERAGLDYLIWDALWKKHRTLANFLWRRGWFSHHCFAVIKKC